MLRMSVPTRPGTMSRLGSNSRRISLRISEFGISIPFMESKSPKRNLSSTVLRKAAERQHRSEHILLSAEKVFAKRPYDEASMQEIAEVAGIGMHGLYQLFPSKSDLYVAVLRVRLHEIRERLPTHSVTEDTVAWLRQFALAYCEFFYERPQFFPMFVTQKLSDDWGLSSRLGKQARAEGRRLEGELLKAMEAAVESGVVVRHDPKLLAAVAMGIFISVMQFELLTEQRRSAAECAEAIVKLFLQGAGVSSGGFGAP